MNMNMTNMMKNVKMFNADSTKNAILVHSLQKNVSNNRSMKNTFLTTTINNMNVMSTNTHEIIANTVFDSNAQAQSISKPMRKSNLFVKYLGMLALLITSIYTVFGQTKLVSFPGYNSATVSFPVSSNFNNSVVTSANLNYGGTGITTVNDGRTVWSIANASSSLNIATAPYLQYNINFSGQATISFDRFVLDGAAALFSTSAIFQLRWSVDNYASSLGTFTNNTSSYKLTSVSLSSLGSLQMNNVSFRVYIYNSGNVLFYNSDTGPYASPDGTPSSYTAYGRNVSVWVSSASVIVPPTISGTTSALVSTTSQLSGTNTAAASSPWVSSNTTVATVSSTGLVTAQAPGSATIT